MILGGSLSWPIKRQVERGTEEKKTPWSGYWAVTGGGEGERLGHEEETWKKVILVGFVRKGELPQFASLVRKSWGGGVGDWRAQQVLYQVGWGESVQNGSGIERDLTKKRSRRKETGTSLNGGGRLQSLRREGGTAVTKKFVKGNRSSSG